jgi:hypothetical protein
VACPLTAATVVGAPASRSDEPPETMSPAHGTGADAARVRHAWIAGVLHSTGSALVLLTTGVNIVLAAHYPLVSALAILLLAYGIRRGSGMAALLLFLATVTPAAVKLGLGALHLADLPAFPLAAVYLRGVVGAVRLRRPRR